MTAQRPTWRFMTELEVLREMRQLFEDPKRWTQRAFARNANGQPVEVVSKSARCFCLTAGHDRIVRPSVIPTVRDCLGPAPHEAESWEAWNDDLDRTHAEVLAVIDARIKHWEGEDAWDTHD